MDKPGHLEWILKPVETVVISPVSARVPVEVPYQPIPVESRSAVRNHRDALADRRPRLSDHHSAIPAP